MGIKVKPNKYYLYHHIIPDTEEVFYVGVGKHSRILNTKNGKRNSSWTEQFEKTGLILEIIEEFDRPKEAYEAEILEIKRLRDQGHKLTNISGGGKGGQRGVKPWNAGVKNPFSKETLKKLSISGKRYYSNDENRVKHAKKCGSDRIFEAIHISTGKIEWRGYRQIECARIFDLRQDCISKVLQGKAKSHKGFTFRYVISNEQEN